MNPKETVQTLRHMAERESSPVLKPFPVTYFCRKWFPADIKHQQLCWDRNAVVRIKMNQTLTMKLELNSGGTGIAATVLGQSGLIDTQFFGFFRYYGQGLSSLSQPGDWDRSPISVERVLAPLHDDPDSRLDPCESRDFQTSINVEGMLRNKIQSLVWKFNDVDSKLEEVEAGFTRGKEAMERAIIDLFDVWA